MADEQGKNDKELADRVRAAATDLCRALNAAGKAGLHAEVSVKPHSWQTFGNGDKKMDDFMPYVEIKRIAHV